MGIQGGGGVLVESESPVPSSGSVLGLNPTKAFGFSVEGWYALKKGICPLPFQKNKFEQCHYGNSSEFSDDVIHQWVHENLLCIGDAAFPGL